jgi:FKBP-type peptidyl-prolyl cis-trans isomerase FklB
MTSKSLVLASALVALSSVAAPTVPSPFKTPQEATSYAVGADMMRNAKSQEVPLDLDMLILGLRDAAGGGPMKLEEPELRRLVSELETDVQKKLTATRKVDGERNRVSSEAFLKTNAQAPGVITLASGVQYRPLKTGTGARPTAEGTVTARYSGSLIDGTRFFSNESDKPAVFKVSSVMPGWREALQLMPAGSRWEIVVPASLAYGERGAGRAIGPNQALKFDLEVLEVR